MKTNMECVILLQYQPAVHFLHAWFLSFLTAVLNKMKFRIFLEHLRLQRSYVTRILLFWSILCLSHYIYLVSLLIHKMLPEIYEQDIKQHYTFQGNCPLPPPHPKGRGRRAVSQKRIIIHPPKHEKVELNFFQLVQSIASRCNRRLETTSVPKHSLLKVPKLKHYYFLEFNWCDNKF